MTVDSTGSTKNPADDSTLAGAFSFIIKKAMQAANGQLPAKVISYNRQTNTAKVQPLIAMMDSEDRVISRGTIANVPVLALGAQVGGAGFVINFPIKAGTVGWIMASDRDISLFKQSSLNEAQPQTLRSNSFEDGLFVPDVFQMFQLDDEDGEAMVIQSVDGKTRIAIDAEEIRVTAPTKVKVTAPDVEVIGNVTVQGNVAVTGTITADGEITGAGIPLSTHKHSGVQPGSGNSGGPTA